MKTIKIKLSGGQIPKKGSEHAAAYDLYVPEDTTLAFGRQVVPLGFSMQMPLDWSADIRPRSGFSAKGMEVLVRTTYSDAESSFTREEVMRIDADVLLGLVDGDYRNECGVIINNRQRLITAHQKKYHNYTICKNEFILLKGTRIAQMKVDSKGEEFNFEQVEDLDYSNDRGGGFGHTGT